MKALKVLSGIAGAIGIGFGVLLMAAAIGVAAWIGGDDTVELPQIQVETDTGLVVLDDIDILAESDRYVGDLGQASITVTADNGDEVFVGITDTRRLSGLVANLDLEEWDASMWTASDLGRTATVDFEITEGDWSLVMVGPDAEALDLTIDAEVTATPFRIAAGMVGTFGFASALFGGLLLWLGLRRERPQPPVQPVAPAPVAA